MSEHPVKMLLDAASIGTVIATIAGWLPKVAALLTIIWTVIRIWESATMKKLTGRLA